MFDVLQNLMQGSEATEDRFLAAIALMDKVETIGNSLAKKKEIPTDLQRTIAKVKNDLIKHFAAANEAGSYTPIMERMNRYDEERKSGEKESSDGDEEESGILISGI
jgi:hypothetical protein